MTTISAGPSLGPSSNHRAKLRRGLFNFQAAPMIVSGYPGLEIIAKLASAGMRAGGAAEGIQPAEHVRSAAAGCAHTIKASLAAQVFAMGGD